MRHDPKDDRRGKSRREELWERCQKTVEARPLTLSDIQLELNDFQTSEDRRRMFVAINFAKLSHIDYDKRDRVMKIIAAAHAALVASVGYANETFFSEERVRMLKLLSGDNRFNDGS